MECSTWVWEILLGRAHPVFPVFPVFPVSLRINHGSFSSPMLQNPSDAEGRLSWHPRMAHLLWTPASGGNEKKREKGSLEM